VEHLAAVRSHTSPYLRREYELEMQESARTLLFLFQGTLPVFHMQRQISGIKAAMCRQASKIFNDQMAIFP